MVAHFLKYFKIKEAKAVRKSSLPFRFDIAMHLVEIGDLEAALHVLKSCIKDGQENVAIYFYLGLLYQKLGQCTAAAEAFEKCLELDREDPFDVRAHLWLVGKAEQPSTLSLTYLRQLFDQYADYFDE